MSVAEAEAWAPAERLTASEWAERYRRLPRRGRAEPGDYRLSRTPYMREILDTLGDAETEEIFLMKVPQVAGSETGRTAIGFWADTRGDPILLVYPNEDAANEEIIDRVAPMFQESPQLRRHLTGRAYDVNEGQIDLVGSTIYVAWTGSAQALASRAIGCAIYEETDKGVRKPSEAPSDDLIRHRLKTFRGRKKFFALSTPTTRHGTIYRLWGETHHKREYYCPCPRCGALTCWGFDHVRWEGRDKLDAKEPAALLEQVDGVTSGARASWIECPHCQAEIHDGDRMRAVEAGEWVSVGHPPGERPRSKRIAYHLEALVSPWVSIADYVEAYLRGVLSGDLQDFLNGFRGLPAEEVSGQVATSVFEERAQRHPAWIVPDWATMVTAGADTQATGGQPYWVWVIRAWGLGLRSRLIGWGRAESPQELVDQTINATLTVEGGARHPVSPSLLCVDSGGGVETVDGSTTELVYAMAKADPARIVAVKGHGGASRPDRLVRAGNVDYQPPGRAPTSVLLHVLDTEGLKDILARLIRSTGPELWEESAAADATYVEQMTAEEKTRMRVGRRWRFMWINTTRRRNDVWDASVYALAAAKILKVEERALGPPAGVVAAAAREVARPRETPSPEATRGDERQGGRFGARMHVDRERKWITRRRDR